VGKQSGQNNVLKKIGLISLGCPKNLVDSEHLLGILHQSGYEVTLDEQQADIVIVNTCSFIKDAEKESVRTILNLTEAGKKVIVAGCLPQKYGQELKQAMPEVLGFIGTGDLQKIKDIIEGKTGYEVPDKPQHRHIENAKRFHISVGASAYIKIAEGCDYFCSFCVIPSLRGPYTSRPVESIVEEARQLAKDGVNEIILIAQDTASYGKDLYGKPSLSRLLEELNGIEELSWIRTMYFYPSNVTDKLLHTIARLEKVVKYVDIPFQHSHPEILKAMRRPAVNNGELIEKIRAIIPGVAIRTIFITGFPGETQGHFEHLCDFVERYRFDKLGVFGYSKEDSTPSGGMKDQVIARVKTERKNRIMTLQQDISREINKSLIGKIIPSIVETVADKQVIGRTYRDAPEVDGLVYIETDELLAPGEIVEVKIIRASEYDLRGTIF